MRNEVRGFYQLLNMTQFMSRGVVDIAQQTCPNSRSPKEGEE
jgi:hypothetical protein